MPFFELLVNICESLIVLVAQLAAAIAGIIAAESFCNV